MLSTAWSEKFSSSAICDIGIFVSSNTLQTSHISDWLIQEYIVLFDSSLTTRPQVLGSNV
nr:hypothetical protein [Bacteroides stercorirosoris]